MKLAMCMVLAFVIMFTGACSPKTTTKTDAPATDITTPAVTAPADTAATDKEEGLVFGAAIMKNAPFTVELYKGIKSICDENGIKLIEYYADNNIETQLAQIDDLLQQGIDGLIVMAVDYQGIKPGLEAAAAAGIPVVSVDSPVYDEALTIAYVASDNYNAGFTCGKNVVDTLEAGNVVILSAPEIKACIDRVQGFKDAIATNPNLVIVSEQSTDAVMDKALSVMENIMQAQSQIDVVFGNNDASAEAAVTSLKGANRLEGVQIYGVDGEQTMFDYISNGEATGDAAQQPFEMGATGTQLLMKHLAGEKVDYENLLKTVLVTIKNCAEYKGF